MLKFKLSEFSSQYILNNKAKVGKVLTDKADKVGMAIEQILPISVKKNLIQAKTYIKNCGKKLDIMSK